MAADGARFEELATGVLAPLVLGGELHLARPFGHSGLSVGEGRRMLDADLRSRVEVARVRRARLIAPIDTLPDFDASDWAIAAALNDLLQLTNHELGGLFTQGRYQRLTGTVLDVCSRIPRPRDVGVALARHATFARVMELGRSDTSVSWWTGSANFRGAPPPKRLMLWRDLRRVRIDTQRVPLTDMADGLPSSVEEGFLRVLSAWLSCSPLTDIASMTRPEPAFAWTPATIALVAVAPGRVLAFRMLSRVRIESVSTTLERAKSTLSRELSVHLPVVEEFSREVVAGLEALRGKPDKRDNRVVSLPD